MGQTHARWQTFRLGLINLCLRLQRHFALMASQQSSFEPRVKLSSALVSKVNSPHRSGLFSQHGYNINVNINNLLGLCFCFRKATQRSFDTMTETHKWSSCHMNGFDLFVHVFQWCDKHICIHLTAFLWWQTFQIQCGKQKALNLNNNLHGKWQKRKYLFYCFSSQIIKSLCMCN